VLLFVCIIVMKLFALYNNIYKKYNNNFFFVLQLFTPNVSPSPSRANLASNVNNTNGTPPAHQQHVKAANGGAQQLNNGDCPTHGPILDSLYENDSKVRCCCCIELNDEIYN
jgi:hypothetical protein